MHFNKTAKTKQSSMAYTNRNGQPCSLVVGWTTTDLRHHLIPRVLESLKLAGIPSRPIRDLQFDADGSLICFTTTERFHMDTAGMRGYGEFWDHWAKGEE